MADQDLLPAIAVTGAFVGIALLAIWAVFKIISSRKPKLRPRASTPPWVWLFLAVVVAFITYSTAGSPRPGRAPAPQPAPIWMVLACLFGTIIVMVVVLIGRQFYQQYDRAASRALKRGQAGDTAGAIAELQDAMGLRKPSEARPGEQTAPWNPYSAPLPRRNRSAVRSYTMGLLHFMREEWPEAYQWFLEAEEVGGRQAHYLGNQGVMLWKMGRSDEAVVLLEAACSGAPQDVVQPCNLGLVLVDLGRLDEAREQLARAEANYKKLVMFPASAKEPIGAVVESLREKLEVEPGSRVSLGG
jgi:hypothetical protein